MILYFCCDKHKQIKVKYARVAQWWSTSLPRRGSRVRVPSRALSKKRTSNRMSFFLRRARETGSAYHAYIRMRGSRNSPLDCSASRARSKKKNIFFTQSSRDGLCTPRIHSYARVLERSTGPFRISRSSFVKTE